MPHADASLIPASTRTKPEFWLHVHSQFASLLDGQRHWVSNLANASSLIYNSLLSSPLYFGNKVNWCGKWPRPRIQVNAEIQVDAQKERLLLGPFCGKPACQFINVEEGHAHGVCADAFLQKKTVVVANVDLYPGHIACDGETKSEIVCPLILTIVLGVLDLDCRAENGFDADDKVGLERLTSLMVKACDW